MLEKEWDKLARCWSVLLLSALYFGDRSLTPVTLAGRGELEHSGLRPRNGYLSTLYCS